MEGNNERRYDTIIIGGGPGGYTAALYCTRSGLTNQVLEKLSPGGQMASTGQVDNYPGFDQGIDGFDLGERMKKGADRFGAETSFEEVVSVDLTSQPKTIITSSRTLQANTVILATGASPRKLGLPEEDSLLGRGIAYCAACDGMMFRDKTVVVTGGGNTAAGDALLLAKICKKVYLVHRRDQLRASQVYYDFLKKSKVELILNSRITELCREKQAGGPGGRLTGVLLENVESGRQQTLSCDGLFVAIGRVPDTQLFAGQIQLDGGGYVMAGEDTKTNLPGVFAVGDIRTKPMRQIITAAADGAVASQSAEEYIAGL